MKPLTIRYNYGPVSIDRRVIWGTLGQAGVAEGISGVCSSIHFLYRDEMIHSTIEPYETRQGEISVHLNEDFWEFLRPRAEMIDKRPVRPSDEDLTMLWEDLQVARGELMVDIKEAMPGTTAGRLLVANRVLARQLDDRNYLFNQARALVKLCSDEKLDPELAKLGEGQLDKLTSYGFEGVARIIGELKDFLERKEKEHA